MTTPPLNDLQRLVTKHYANGEYEGHAYHIPGDAGDTLFDFLMSEADEDAFLEAKEKGVTPTVVLLARVGSAIGQLVHLQGALLDEVVQ